MKNYKVEIDGIILEAEFKQSKVQKPEFNGDLTVTMEDATKFEVQEVAKTMGMSNIVKFGANQNSFVINYIKESDCNKLFGQICDCQMYPFVKS